jgi:hypothetical protein
MSSRREESYYFLLSLELNRIWSKRHKIGFVDLRGCRTLSVLRPTSLFLVPDSICHRKGYKTNFYNCAKCRGHFPLSRSFQQETDIKRSIHISHPIQKTLTWWRLLGLEVLTAVRVKNTSGIWPSDTSGEYTGWMHVQRGLQTDWARVILLFTKDNCVLLSSGLFGGSMLLWNVRELLQVYTASFLNYSAPLMKTGF